MIECMIDQPLLGDPERGAVLHTRIDHKTCIRWLMVESLRPTFVGRMGARLVEMNGEGRIGRIYSESSAFHGESS